MRRRGRGEGSIFRRRDGKWCGIFTVGWTETGKRRRRYIYGDTKQEVLEQMTRLRSQVLDGTLGDPARLTLTQFLERWLEDSVRPSVRPKTYEFYRLAVRHVVPILGGVPVAKLAPFHLQGMLAEMERAGFSPHARRTAICTLRTALGQAVRLGMIPRNPADLISKPRAPRREMRTMTPEQARAFLEAAREDRYFALYAVLLGCGLRIAEAMALTWPDVDLEEGRLVVRRQLVELSGGQLVFQEPKTGSARRTIDMPPFVIEALREHQARMVSEGHLVTDHLLVFVDTHGGPVRPSNLRNYSFLPLLRRAGIPRLRLHDLRHTFATLNLIAGTHPKVVQQALGHANVGITLQTYSHVLPSLGKGAALTLDRILRGEYS